jgi:hypothetical protein
VSLDAAAKWVYLGVDLLFCHGGAVSPVGGKEVRVRVTGALRDDVDVRLIVESLIDAVLESERSAVGTPECADAGRTESTSRKADRS